MTETTLQEDLFIGEFKAMSEQTYKVGVEHGFYPSKGVPNAPTFGDAIALIHSELSEALEAFRDGDDMTAFAFKVNDDLSIAKPEGVAAELADTIIRIMNTAEYFGIPVAQAVVVKNRYNATREYRHGGKKL